jgi:hypothetical protein
LQRSHRPEPLAGGGCQRSELPGAVALGLCGLVDRSELVAVRAECGGLIVDLGDRGLEQLGVEPGLERSGCPLGAGAVECGELALDARELVALYFQPVALCVEVLPGHREQPVGLRKQGYDLAPDQILDHLRVDGVVVAPVLRLGASVLATVDAARAVPAVDAVHRGAAGAEEAAVAERVDLRAVVGCRRGSERRYQRDMTLRREDGRDLHHDRVAVLVVGPSAAERLGHQHPAEVVVDPAGSVAREQPEGVQYLRGGPCGVAVVEDQTGGLAQDGALVPVQHEPSRRSLVGRFESVAERWGSAWPLARLGASAQAAPRPFQDLALLLGGDGGANVQLQLAAVAGIDPVVDEDEPDSGASEVARGRERLDGVAAEAVHVGREDHIDLAALAGRDDIGGSRSLGERQVAVNACVGALDDDLPLLLGGAAAQPSALVFQARALLRLLSGADAVIQRGSRHGGAHSGSPSGSWVS